MGRKIVMGMIMICLVGCIFLFGYNVVWNLECVRGELDGIFVFDGVGFNGENWL